MYQNNKNKIKTENNKTEFYLTKSDKQGKVNKQKKVKTLQAKQKENKQLTFGPREPHSARTIKIFPTKIVPVTTNIKRHTLINNDLPINKVEVIIIAHTGKIKWKLIAIKS